MQRVLNIYYIQVDLSKLYEKALRNSFSTQTRTKKKPVQHERLSKASHKQAVISCKRPEFNHYLGQTYGKFDIVPLASKGWHHNKSKGDCFTINAYGEIPGTKRVFETPEVSFEDTGISSKLVDVLKRSQVSTPTNIQVKGIPSLLSGNNTLLAGETGCGKTLAYLLPLLQQILRWKTICPERELNSPLGLIISPGRELAQQIASVANEFSEDLPFKTQVLTGGRTKKVMLNPSFDEVDLLIATLGALSKLTTTGVYRMSHVRHVVLDEADTLLDDSFNEKLKYFLQRFPFQYSGPEAEMEFPLGAQLTLVSATMPTSLPEVLSEIIVPESLNKITTNHLHHILPHVPQRFLRLGRAHKPGKLLQLVKGNIAQKEPVIIFSNKSATCDWVSMFLTENNVNCVNLHGDMHLEIRNGKFRQFQTGQVDVISCTDIGSRGLDTIRAKHVLNYDFPIHMADYIHRSGRTGRVGSSSHSYVTNFIAGHREVDLVHKIELAVRKMNALPNVNANITKIIKHKIMKEINTVPI